MEDKDNNETQSATVDTGEGDKPSLTPTIDEANSAAERMARQNDRREELLNREEQLMAKKALGGSSEAGGQAPEKKELTDIEYAEALERGEVNPLKEDGFN